jgi:hypothetical protein
MTDKKKIQELKAQIAIQRAEKASQEAQQSTRELQKLEKTLTSRQVKQATEKVVREAAGSAVDNIIKEKKINNELKVKQAKQLQEQAKNARVILDLKKKKKKSRFNKKHIFLLLVVAFFAYIYYNRETGGKVIESRSIITNISKPN